MKHRSRRRVLVAGAAGFIGSHLCERLLQDGFEVVGLDNLLTGRLRNLRHLEREPLFDFLQHDIVEPIPDLGPFDWVFHLASPASPPAYQEHALECLRTNSEGTLQLLRLALDQRARFFLTSTSEVYGDPLQHPQRESYWGNVNPVGPRSMYDEGKRYAETLTTTFRKFHGLSTRIVRIFNTYGPRMDPDDGRVVSNFLCQALRGEPLTIYGDGQQTRSFQYVDDLVEGMRRMMEVEYLLPINLGMPEEFSIAELVELIGELLGRPVTAAYHPLPGDDPKQRRPDITLARQILGWQPKVPLAEGLRRTLQYFEACLEAACASDSRALGVPPGIEPRMPG